MSGSLSREFLRGFAIALACVWIGGAVRAPKVWAKAWRWRTHWGGDSHHSAVSNRKGVAIKGEAACPRASGDTCILWTLRGIRGTCNGWVAGDWLMELGVRKISKGTALKAKVIAWKVQINLTSNRQIVWGSVCYFCCRNTVAMRKKSNKAQTHNGSLHELLVSLCWRHLHHLNFFPSNFEITQIQTLILGAFRCCEIGSHAIGVLISDGGFQGVDVASWYALLQKKTRVSYWFLV